MIMKPVGYYRVTDLTASLQNLCHITDSMHDAPPAFNASGFLLIAWVLSAQTIFCAWIFGDPASIERISRCLFYL
ncbi:MAG: hypothetical protein ACHQQQ_04310 [Bacteroidota bacterium]